MAKHKRKIAFDGYKGTLVKHEELSPKELKKLEKKRKIAETVMLFDRDAAKPSQRTREAEAAAKEPKKRWWQR